MHVHLCTYIQTANEHIRVIISNDILQKNEQKRNIIEQKQANHHYLDKLKWLEENFMN